MSCLKKKRKKKRHQELVYGKKTEKVGIEKQVGEPSKVGEQNSGKSYYKIFSLFFTSEIIAFIREQTELYSRRDKNYQSFSLSEEELRQFLGLLIISGYHNLPSENDYWSTAEYMETSIFPKTMSRERFRVIKRYLHQKIRRRLYYQTFSKNIIPVWVVLILLISYVPAIDLE